MRIVLAVVLAILTIWSVSPADAYVVHITTSVPVSDGEDEVELKAALQRAVDDVLSRAIGFTPTLIVLTNALVLNDRLYIRLLIADDEGRQAFDELREASTTTEKIGL